MKNNKVDETVNRMKLLFEYHFKTGNTPQELSSEPQMKEENPVKFSEIGDKYSDSDNDYPAFSDYRDEVMIDEEDPTGDEETPQEAPAEAPVNDTPPTAPVQEPVAPEQPPIEQPAPPAPAPVSPPASQTVPVAVEPQNNSLEAKLDMQIQQTQMVLQQIMSMQQNDFGKLDQVAKKVEDLTNPSAEKQFDMISKKSYPYNIKLSDYWDWKGNEDAQEEKEQNFELTQDDVNNYDPNLIKQSLNITE